MPLSLKPSSNTIALYKQLATCFILLFFISCNKADFNFDRVAANQWDAEFAVPLVNSTVGINDLNLPAGSYLQVNADNSQSIVYNGNFANVKAGDFVTQISAAPVTTSYTLTATDAAAFALVATGANYTATSSQTMNCAAQTNTGSGMDLDSMQLKTGNLVLQVQNNFNHNATITITIPAIKNAGVAFTNTIAVAANAKAQLTTNLANAKIDLSKSGTTQNKIEIFYAVSFTKNNNTTSGNISFTGSLTDAAFKTLYGNVHQQTLLNKVFDSIALPVFKDANGLATITLSNPSIKLNFNNSFGIPFSTSFISIKGYNQQKGNFYLNTSSINPNPFIINAATQGQTVTTSVVLDKSNPAVSGSNSFSLISFLSNMPYAIVPQVNTQTNPAGVLLPAYKNFITDTSSVVVTGVVTVPLEGSLSGFAVKDTFDFSFGMVDNIESFTLRTLLKNGFPVNLTANFIFVDAAYKPVYILDATTNPLLAAAVVDATGVVTAKTTTTSEFLIGGTVVPNLNKVKKIIMNVAVASVANGQQNVKITADNKLDIIMGIKAKPKF